MSDLVNKNEATFSEVDYESIELYAGSFQAHFQQEYETPEVLIKPSVVSRSDATVLSIDSPRFAHRAYLNKKRSSFINIRRSEAIGKKLPATWANQKGNEILSLEEIDSTPKSMLENSSIIGDSIFEVPLKIQEEFDLVGSDLGRLYGDIVYTGENCTQIPYLHQFPFSGECAQASIFMVNVLMNKFSSRALGLSEISCVAQEHQSDSGFTIEGIGFNDMERVFKKIGLKARIQLTEPFNLTDEDSNYYLEPEKEFLSSIEAYIQSGFPVVFPTTTKRLQSEGVYQQIESVWGEMDEIKEDEPHVVTIIGVSKNLKEGKKVFLLNDTALLPLLEINQDQLINAAFKYGEFRPNLDSQIRAKYGTTEIVDRLNRSPFFMAVCPSNVCNFLCPSISKEEQINRPGLMNTLSRIFDKISKLTDVSEKLHQNINIDNIRSSPPFAGGLILRRIKHTELIKQLENLTSKWQWKLENGSFQDDLWVWEQDYAGVTWLWDASFVNANGTEFADIAIGIFPTKPQLHKINCDSGISSPLPKTSQLEPIKGLTPAIITSCNTSGFSECIKDLPADCEHIELYTFLREDIKCLFPSPYADQNQFPIEVMADLLEEDDVILEIANNIQNIINSSSNPNVKITSIATYFPGFIESWTSISHDSSVRAVKFCFKLAKYLKEVNPQHHIKSIEIVCGSRVSQVSLAKFEKKSKVMRIDFHNTSKQMTKCIEYLEELLEFADDLNSTCNLAIEMEPGPLFWLNSKSMIENLASRLIYLNARHKSKVGFNIDIGHMACLENIDPSIVDKLSHNIIHAHISDHSIGHFSDLPIGSLHPDKLFHSWLTKLSELTSNEQSPFDGVVSLELEALNNPQLLENSWTYYKNLLS